jgi:hypothetical protein
MLLNPEKFENRLLRPTIYFTFRFSRLPAYPLVDSNCRWIPLVLTVSRREEIAETPDTRHFMQVRKDYCGPLSRFRAKVVSQASRELR